jgi:hypothetical protein
VNDLIDLMVDRSSFLVGVVLLVLVGMAGPPVLRIGDFSGQSPTRSLPEGWTQVRFGENDSSTRYDLVRRDSTVVVRARSENGASGLVTQRRVDLSRYPILEWRWKVEALPRQADVTTDTTADAAARLYVMFDYDGLGVLDRLKLMILRRVAFPEAPSRALNYLWASTQAQGQSTRSPYTDQIRLLPVRSGARQAGTWVREQRNVRRDYRALFGEEPPPVSGIALMTDTDNTGGTARALYGDIVFRAARDSARAAAPDRP